MFELLRPKNLPTDREVMREIYDTYSVDYPGNEFEEGKPGPNDPHIEIDIPLIARKLGCRPELLHGILYFHLNDKYGYEDRDKVFVRMFEKKVEAETNCIKTNCINFPYLASKLAALEEEHRKMLLTRWISIMSIIISCFALGTRIFGAEL